MHSLQYDFLQRDTDPFPEVVDGEREDHGTNVAGEVGMEKGNDICGTGVAFNSFITGYFKKCDAEVISATCIHNVAVVEHI